MECSLRKLAELLTEMADKYDGKGYATVYVGNRDGSSDGVPRYLVGELVDGNGVNHCIFKIGPKDPAEGESWPSLDEDDSPHVVEGGSGKLEEDGP